MFSKQAKKGFTLIEMLIVIVIIGILAAALIPRLSSARGRANDVARKADLAQVASAIVSYQIDNGKFLDCTDWCPLSELSTGLIQAWMNSIPEDPSASRIFSGIANPVAWQYSYITIKKWWLWDNGFVLMAWAETVGWANWVYTWNITNTMNYEDLNLCKTFNEIPSGSPSNGWTGLCTYVKGTDVLRYIYKY